MNFFSSDEYLEVLARTWFPGRAWRLEPFELEGWRFRLLDVEGLGPVVTDGARADAYHFLDFFQPLEDAPEPGVESRPLRWLPRASIEREEISSSTPGEPARGTSAPYVAWARFPAWSDFEAHVASRRASLHADSRRKRRRLAERHGPLRFRWDDRRPASFDTALAWKSAQYVRTSQRDGLAIPENVTMFRELVRRGIVTVSSLSAGERLVAVHLGVAWRRRFFSWIPAYDRDLTVLSPGRLLLEELLAESHRRGDEEYDFLIGAEPYKYHYATHRRIVRSLGTPPLPVSLRRAVRSSVKRALSVYPPLLVKARALENGLGRWRGGRREGAAP